MRTIVIGLDAATWRVMTPLIDQEKLPNIQTLIQGGVSGMLRSTVPPMTPPAWTSIATGVNPGKHGIYDFVGQDLANYSVSPIHYSHMTPPAVWDIFNFHGRKVGVVNFPLVFPPPKIHSFFISGIASPESKDFAYPPRLQAYLNEKGYRIHTRFGPKNGAQRYFQEVKDLTRIQCNVILELMQEKDWDLFWIVFMGLDWIQHYLWNSELNGENAVEVFYQYMDREIGEILKRANEDWNILILSDHGFRGIKAEIHLNNILEEWGYLKRAKVTEGAVKRLRHSPFKIVLTLGRILPLSVQQTVYQHMPQVIRSNLQKLLNDQLQLHKMINWDQTKAFSYGYTGRIYIHVKGKYPQGIVSPGKEYETLLEEIIERLRALKDPETKEPIISEVFRKRDLYAGRNLKNAPDIIFTPFDFRYSIYGNFGMAWYHTPPERVADHDIDGIFIMKGKNTREAFKMNAEAVDIAPTLLYLHDLPVLEDMDGRVLREAFTGNFRKKQKVQTLENISASETNGYTLEEPGQKEIERHLKDLGYL
jgi:predicted AlkP superfamily phosphohydrolase/phosphomutase